MSGSTNRQAVAFTLFGAVLGATGLLLASTMLGLGALVPAAGPTGGPVAGGAASSAPVEYVGSLQLEPASGSIGSTTTLRGAGFDPDVTLDIVWQSFSGAWIVDNSASGGENYKGRRYEQVAVPLGTATTSSDGTFSADFTVPDGFGFTHTVQVLEDGKIRNQAGFSVDMEVSISPTSGPVGTPITIAVRGIGTSPLHSSWELTYDNAFTGWMSAVTTEGHATFTVPATGAPGPHVLKILHGSFTFPYLNMQQSPDPDRPTFMSIFTVTPGDPVLPPAPDLQWNPVVRGTEPPPAAGPAVWTDPLETIVGATVVLHGRDLPAGASLSVGWLTQVGVDTAIIGGTGVDRPTADWDLGAATVAADGTFAWEFIVPADKGGWHELTVSTGDTVVAATQMRVRPMAAPLGVTQARVGDQLTIHLTGVDDTDTGKIRMLVYDNAMLGYSCSVTGQGDITIYLPAAGAVGWHFIDLYPGLYKGQDQSAVYNFRIPQLTYADDHAGEILPAFRFAFEIIE